MTPTSQWVFQRVKVVTQLYSQTGYKKTGSLELSGFPFYYLMRKMGLEPTRYCYHKILSLARLPIPTLPHSDTK